LLITRAIQKYGAENFSREILCYADSYEELGQLERAYIKKYNAAISDNFYNIHEGGYGGNTQLGWDRTKKVKFSEKMREITLGSKNGHFGKTHSETTINKLRNIRIEYWENIDPVTKEHFREKMKEVVSGEKNPNYGNKWSDEQKLKLSNLKITSEMHVGIKNGMYGKKGTEALNGKAIYMYNTNYEFVQCFTTRQLALEFLGLKGHVKLVEAIKTGRLYHNHYWHNEKIEKGVEAIENTSLS
jgi:group I intron endonuclease